MHKLFKFCLSIDILHIVFFKLWDNLSGCSLEGWFCFGWSFPFIGCLWGLMRTMLHLRHHGCQIICSLRSRGVLKVHLIRILLTDPIILWWLSEIHPHGSWSYDHASHSAIHVTAALSWWSTEIIIFCEYVAKHSARLRNRAVTAASIASITVDIGSKHIIRFTPSRRLIELLIILCFFMGRFLLFLVSLMVLILLRLYMARICFESRDTLSFCFIRWFSSRAFHPEISSRRWVHTHGRRLATIVRRWNWL